MTDIRKIRTQLRKRSNEKILAKMLSQVQTDISYAYAVLGAQTSPASTGHIDAPKAAEVTEFGIFNEAEIQGGFF